MLHIVNGDAALAILKETPLKGKFVVWKDMLMEGPAAPAQPQGKVTGEAAKSAAKISMAKKAAAKAKPPGLADSLDWKARSAFLRDRYGIEPKKYLAAVKSGIAALEKAAKGKDEVVFWFEEDFFCQIHLVYLLAHLPAPLRKKGRAFVICPEKPLGIRLPKAMEKLFAGRIPVEPALVALAEKVWAAYSAASNQGWEALLKWAQSGKRFEAWPLLRSGLRSHLGRLPTADGRLNALETALLRSLSEGPQAFPQFVKRVWSEPMARPLGLGDLQVARYALDLAAAKTPLIAIDGPHSNWKSGEAIRSYEWKLHLTDAGRARLEAPAPSRRATA